MIKRKTLLFLVTITLIAFTAFYCRPAQATTLSSYDRQQLNCLAQNIYFEARNQPDAGKLAVTHVVMNRVKSGKFPDTPCSVIKQRRAGKCQFNWACGKSVVRDQVSFKKSFELAIMVYFNKVRDNTYGATFYHAKYVRPGWSRVFARTVRIGDHIFYRGG